MRVVLDNGLFSSGQAQLHVLGIFALAWGERHLLLTDPPYQPGGRSPLHVWLDSLNPGTAAAAKRVLDDSVLAATTQPPGCVEVRIAARARSDWTRGALTREDGLALLATPLRLLLEDQTSDYAFLRCLARPTIREQLDAAVARGWVEVAHGGGIEQIYKRILNAATSCERTTAEWCWQLRLWVMFDRDAQRNDATQPSTASGDLRKACQAITQPWPLGHFQLGRRAIENYLPYKMLFAWAERAPGNIRTRRRRLVQHFRDGLTLQQQRCFPMKDGFGERAILPPPFHDIDSQLISILKPGFGRQLAAEWEPAKLLDEGWLDDLCREDGLDRDTVLGTLLRNL